ncbi:MAG: S1C family serine protease [Parachlamydiales bacterium]
MTDDRKPLTSSNGITLLVLISSSAISLWLAYSAAAGLWVSYFSFLVTLVLGYFFWRQRPWATKALIAKYCVEFLYAGVIAFFFVDYLWAIFEAAVSICAIGLLVGKPSVRRSYVFLSAYAALLVFAGGAIIMIVQQKGKYDQLVTHAEISDFYQSKYQYQLQLEELPWKILSRSQAKVLLGRDIKDADLKLVRDDGSAFGLFFPFTFNNTPYHPHLADQVQSEIQERWLTHLSRWQRHDRPDGFLLTADGNLKGTGLNYVAFYKHFGNLGVYGVLWAEKGSGQRLYEEATLLYTGLSAPPIKQRLPKHTPAETYANNSDAVVLINVFDQDGIPVARGSGFNISPEGLIITNLHVILQGHHLEVVFPKQAPYKQAKVLALSTPELDLAILTLHQHNLPTIAGFKTVPVAPGDPVFVVGNPKGLVNSISEGIVAGIREEGPLTLYQITAPISSGSSGGPVFNEYGEVIGVANSIMVDAQNLNFSISVDELDRLFVLSKPLALAELMDKIKSATPKPHAAP